jgi:hypothetical protein
MDELSKQETNSSTQEQVLVRHERKNYSNSKCYLKEEIYNKFYPYDRIETSEINQILNKQLNDFSRNQVRKKIQ